MTEKKSEEETELIIKAIELYQNGRCSQEDFEKCQILILEALKYSTKIKFIFARFTYEHYSKKTDGKKEKEKALKILKEISEDKHVSSLTRENALKFLDKVNDDEIDKYFFV